MKFENIDLVDALRRIMDIHTQNYKEDFELDAGLLHSLAGSQSPVDKHLLWMSRPNGTYLLPEREVYVEDSYENKVWEFYHEQTRDPILAYAVEIKSVEGDTVRGDLIELDYAAHVERMQKLTVPVETVAVSFKDDATFYLPFRSYRREAIPLEEKHGKVVSVSYLPENATELDMILRRERFKTGFHAKTGSIEDHIHKLAVQHGVTEKLGILPLEAQTAYNAVKEAHPEAIVCFAQNGYFEIYGEDAKKAAPALGTKLLMKELEGGGQVAVGLQDLGDFLCDSRGAGQAGRFHTGQINETGRALCFADNKVARVHMGGVLRLVLALQNLSSLGGHTTENLILRVDDDPLALNLTGLCMIRLHCFPPIDCRFCRAAEASSLRRRGSRDSRGGTVRQSVCFQKCTILGSRFPTPTRGASGLDNPRRLRFLEPMRLRGF